VRDSVKTHNKEVSKYLIIYNLDLQDTTIQVFNINILRTLKDNNAYNNVKASELKECWRIFP
jgi:hypothetical protein